MELQTDDVTLHYEDDGDAGAPPVLMLHGITQSTATWGWLVPHLAGSHRVVRLDFRGHGRSGRMPGGYGHDGFLADAVAVCERVLETPAVVVGHSLGGGAAAALAQTRPELVRGVVLEDPAIMARSSGEGQNLEGNSLLDGFRLMRESIPRLQESGISVGDLTNVLRGAPSPSGPTFGELLHDDAIEAMAIGMLELDVTVLDLVFDPTSAPVFDPHRELPVPGIVLAADPSKPDGLVKPADVERLAEQSPKIECRTVTGAGHLIHDSKDHRAAVLDAVNDLLARI